VDSKRGLDEQNTRKKEKKKGRGFDAVRNNNLGQGRGGGTIKEGATFSDADTQGGGKLCVLK